MEQKIMGEIDIRIIRILSENANVTATEISEKINLSIPAVNKRIAKLVNSGVISRFMVIIDPYMVGKPMLAFIFIILESLSHFDELMECIDADPDFLECYATTGEFDYIVKARSKDTLDLEKKLLKLKGVDGVVRTNTTISLFTHKYLPSVLPDFD